MDDFLLVYLTIVGLLALYWVLFGEKRFQQKIQGSNSDKQEMENDKKIKTDDEKNDIKSDKK